MERKAQSNNNRVGLHYFPDDTHYAEAHVETWLPETRALGASWLVLHARPERNVPEPFIKAVLAAGITPVIHLHIPLSNTPGPDALRAAFQAYAAWGVQYVTLFDRPNQRDSWGNGWAQQGLVERFLDVFSPLANEAITAGLTPGFPVLQPGGDYWDTAFLRASLQGLKAREESAIIANLYLNADARTQGHPLDWGAGGPERWAGARPYHTPEGEQDQRGFHIFDWYNAIATASVGNALPLMLLQAGSDSADDARHEAENRELLSKIGSLPANVLVANFWLLAADEGHDAQSAAWFPAGRAPRPVVAALKGIKEQAELKPKVVVTPQPIPDPLEGYPKKGEREVLAAIENGNASLLDGEMGCELDAMPDAAPKSAPADVALETVQPALPTLNKAPIANQSIEHYLLLPRYEWGIADWHLDVIQPFVKKYCPTIGFSVDEAAMAKKVTIVGGATSFPTPIIEQLCAQGCVVEQIEGDGTSIASKLASL